MKKSDKKSSSGLWKKIFVTGSLILALLAAGFAGYLIGNEDSRDDFEDKSEEVGERLGEWGRDVSRSTKKLFD